MAENVARDRETSSAAAAWLLRGRPESSRSAILEHLPLDPPPSLPAPEPTPAVPVDSRNWSSTLDLIHEAATAIRISEERTVELEQELDRAVAHALERQHFLEAQIAAAETRALAAEARAQEAEAWLARLHEAVVAGFSRNATQPRDGAEAAT